MFGSMEETRTLEILFAGDAPSSTLADMERRGAIRRLATGIYTRNLSDPPEAVVHRNWVTIVGHQLPNAVITDRSAPIGGPVDGVLYVSSQGRGRAPIELPGLTISRRPGPGPTDGDIPLPGGAFLASKPRRLMDNAAPSRARKGAARTLSAIGSTGSVATMAKGVSLSTESPPNGLRAQSMRARRSLRR
jgi:hypothetical protein